MITLTIYIFEGIGRSYIVFLFKQLDEPNSPIPLDKEQKSWIGEYKNTYFIYRINHSKEFYIDGDRGTE